MNKLFKTYKSKTITLIINSLMGLNYIFLLSALSIGLYFFFSIKEGTEILLSSSKLVLLSSIIFTTRSAYNILYSGSDQALLKALPVHRNEIIIANTIYYYSSQIIISLYIFTVAFLANGSFNLQFTIIFILFIIIVPLIGIILSFFLSCVIHLIISHIKKNEQKKNLFYIKKSLLFSLILYERNNFFLFSLLITEFVSFIFLYIYILFISLRTNITIIETLLIFPAITMINISSFSREGSYHNTLESFPIPKKTRILSKALFFYILHLPLLFICFFVTSLKSNNNLFLLTLIPTSILFINTALFGLAHDKKAPKIDWTNPKEVFQINLPHLFLNIFLGICTALPIFHSDLLNISPITGLLTAIIFNLVIFIFRFKRILPIG
ncbi:MAG: hypothetical protein J6U56_09315 [Spirochaetia bacterium]|nr:hypothetical protein [Spirochaetia bacterium]